MGCSSVGGCDTMAGAREVHKICFKGSRPRKVGFAHSRGYQRHWTGLATTGIASSAGQGHVVDINRTAVAQDCS